MEHIVIEPLMRWKHWCILQLLLAQMY